MSARRMPRATVDQIQAEIMQRMKACGDAVGVGHLNNREIVLLVGELADLSRWIDGERPNGFEWPEDQETA